MHLLRTLLLRYLLILNLKFQTFNWMRVIFKVKAPKAQKEINKARSLRKPTMAKSPNSTFLKIRDQAYGHREVIRFE